MAFVSHSPINEERSFALYHLLACLRMPLQNPGTSFILVLCGAAWLMLFVINPKANLADLCLAIQTGSFQFLEIPDAYFRYIHASLMVIAMMLPLSIPAILKFKISPNLSSRHFYPALYSGVFIGLWVIVVLLLEFMLNNLPFVEARFQLILVAGLFAAAWQSTPYRMHAVLAIRHSDNLDKVQKPSKYISDFSRSATCHALNCMKSCLPIMVLSSVSGHALIPMIVFTLIIWNERFNSRTYPLANTMLLVAMTLLISLSSFYV